MFLFFLIPFLSGFLRYELSRIESSRRARDQSVFGRRHPIKFDRTEYRENPVLNAVGCFGIFLINELFMST